MDGYGMMIHQKIITKMEEQKPKRKRKKKDIHVDIDTKLWIYCVIKF